MKYTMYGDADNNLPKLMDEQMLQWYSFLYFVRQKRYYLIICII